LVESVSEKYSGRSFFQTRSETSAPVFGGGVNPKFLLICQQFHLVHAIVSQLPMPSALNDDIATGIGQRDRFID
jgi:hypothetical protein